MEKPDFELMSWDIATKEWKYVMNIPHEDMALAMERIWDKYVEPLSAELTRTNAQLDEMVTKYNELSKKYADLYTKHYGK